MNLRFLFFFFFLRGVVCALKLFLTSNFGRCYGHLMQRVDSLEKPWCWEGLGAGGEGDDRGWDGWMASPTQWTWVWVNSGSCWWTGRPGVLRFMGLQRVRHDWETDLSWTDCSKQTGFEILGEGYLSFLAIDYVRLSSWLSSSPLLKIRGISW